MTRLKATIKNQDGIHCRPVALITKHALQSDGVVTISSAKGSCTLGSALELMILALRPGDEVVIETQGPNAAELAEEFRQLFETEFDFPKTDES